MQGKDISLLSAAAHGHAECVRLLLDAGADTKVADIVRDSSYPCVRELCNKFVQYLGALVFSSFLYHC